jgi:hypothetical protein
MSTASESRLPTDGSARRQWPRYAGVAFALLLLFLGAFLILFLVFACAIDDTGNPHSCPESYLALVILGAVSALAAWLTARAGWRDQGSSSVLIAVAGAGLLVALLFFLEGGSDSWP